MFQSFISQEVITSQNTVIVLSGTHGSEDGASALTEKEFAALDLFEVDQSSVEFLQRNENCPEIVLINVADYHQDPDGLAQAVKDSM